MLTEDRNGEKTLIRELITGQQRKWVRRCKL